MSLLYMQSIERTSLARVFEHPREYVLYPTLYAYLTVSGFSVHPEGNGAI